MSSNYSVRGFRSLSVVLLTGALALGASSRASAAPLLVENFDSIATLGGSGWLLVNNSTAGGSTGWFQGNTAVFPSQAGAADAYIAANFLNADAGGAISNWLITPSLLLNNGDSLTFYTRTEAGSPFPDRLQVRLSTTGSSVGGTSASVGDFTNLLLDINPAFSNGGYPEGWTAFNVLVAGLGGPTNGRFGFRYLVDDTNVNGNYIGIDTVRVDTTATTAVPEPGTLVLAASGLTGLFIARRRRAQRS